MTHQRVSVNGGRAVSDKAGTRFNEPKGKQWMTFGILRGFAAGGSTYQMTQSRRKAISIQSANSVETASYLQSRFAIGGASTFRKS
jgi:hypothetical protein